MRATSCFLPPYIESLINIYPNGKFVKPIQIFTQNSVSTQKYSLLCTLPFSFFLVLTSSISIGTAIQTENFHGDRILSFLFIALSFKSCSMSVLCGYISLIIALTVILQQKKEIPWNRTYIWFFFYALTTNNVPITVRWFSNGRPDCTGSIFGDDYFQKSAWRRHLIANWPIHPRHVERPWSNRLHLFWFCLIATRRVRRSILGKLDTFFFIKEAGQGHSKLPVKSHQNGPLSIVKISKGI